MSELEDEVNTRRWNHQEAEAAAEALRTALLVNGLPCLPSLDAAPAVEGFREGGYVYLGGCNAHTAQALADLLMQHARWTGQVIPSEADRQVLHDLLPPGFPKERSA